MLKVSLVTIAVLMLLLTLLTFVEDIKLLFTYESAIYLSDISNINIFLSMFFLCINIFLLIYFRKRLKLISPFFFFVCILWLFSGRTLAYKYHPTGRVIIGWYYIKTEIFHLCTPSQDYEKILSKETTIKELSFWRMNFKNRNIDKTIFIGPFIWSEAKEIFKTNNVPHADMNVPLVPTK